MPTKFAFVMEQSDAAPMTSTTRISLIALLLVGVALVVAGRFWRVVPPCPTCVLVWKDNEGSRYYIDTGVSRQASRASVPVAVPRIVSAVGVMVHPLTFSSWRGVSVAGSNTRTSTRYDCAHATFEGDSVAVGPIGRTIRPGAEVMVYAGSATSPGPISAAWQYLCRTAPGGLNRSQ